MPKLQWVLSGKDAAIENVLRHAATSPYNRCPKFYPKVLQALQIQRTPKKRSLISSGHHLCYSQHALSQVPVRLMEFCR